MIRSETKLASRFLATLAATALLSFLPAASQAAVEQVYTTVDDALDLLFPDADRMIKVRRLLQPMEIRKAERSLRRILPEGGYFVFVGTRNGTIDGYAFITNEIGKVEPFTFMVGVNPDGTVRDVIILIYRESQGSEIRHRRFLGQLRDKRLSDPIQVNRDLINISGATLSCNAVAAGIRKILVVADQLYLGRKEAEVLAEIEEHGEVKWDRTERGSIAERPTSSTDADSPVRVVQERYVMGTTCRITLYASGRAAGNRAAAIAFDELQRVDRLLSDYKPDSELSQINARAGEGLIPVTTETFRLLQTLRKYHRESEGAFDPTVRPLMELWGFRGSSELTEPPAPDEIRETLARTGYDRIRFDSDGPTIRCPAGMALDPGAFGKGYGIDRTVALLRRANIDSALIDFGSTCYALGAPPGEDGWKIRVRNPHDEEKPLTECVVANEAISTSGDYEKSIEIGGRRYSHIVNPRNGRPVDGAVSVTVIDDSALAADVRSTAASAMGAEAGREYLKRVGSRGLFITLDPTSGRLRVASQSTQAAAKSTLGGGN